MKRYNLSEIMKRAWTFVRTEKVSLSEALQVSWKIAKSGKARLADWFSNKLATEFGLARLYHLSIFCGIKETEKAVYAMLDLGYDGTGTYAKRKCAWIPKSVIENLSDLMMIPDYDEAVSAFRADH